MNFNLNKLTTEQRKAVAPIIATLLMVAISVVGGILIFVFAQGFFQDTSIQSPTIDSLEIFGYNANDTSGDFVIHSGEFYDAGGTIAATLQEDDPFALFVRNTGSVAVSVESLRIFGVKYTFDVGNVGAAPGSGVPVDGSFLLLQDKDDNHLSNTIIEPGQEVSVIVRYDDETNGNVKVGRPILVQIKTGGGAVFTKQMRNGVETG